MRNPNATTFGLFARTKSREHLERTLYPTFEQPIERALNELSVQCSLNPTIECTQEFALLEPNVKRYLSKLSA